MVILYTFNGTGVSIGVVLLFLLLMYFVDLRRRSLSKGMPQKPDFVIEFYPRTNIYAVKYKNKGWLKTGYKTGIIETSDYFLVVDHYESEEKAREAIALFKEQKFKEGVIKIEVK